jgi:hypothetical protein
MIDANDRKHTSASMHSSAGACAVHHLGMSVEKPGSKPLGVHPKVFCRPFFFVLATPQSHHHTVGQSSSVQAWAACQMHLPHNETAALPCLAQRLVDHLYALVTREPGD